MERNAMQCNKSHRITPSDAGRNGWWMLRHNNSHPYPPSTSLPWQREVVSISFRGGGQIKTNFSLANHDRHLELGLYVLKASNRSRYRTVQPCHHISNRTTQCWNREFIELGLPSNPTEEQTCVHYFRQICRVKFKKSISSALRGLLTTRYRYSKSSNDGSIIKWWPSS